MCNVRCKRQLQIAINEQYVHCLQLLIVFCLFVGSIHLFFMFPRLEEGGLATYRAALVQNQHLTVLAEVCMV